MRRFVALVFVLALVLLARRLGGEASERFATMALGFVLIVASLVGEGAEHLKLPRLTGYLAVGVCFGPSLLNFITPAMTDQLRLVNGIAVALIAFGAGMEMDLPALRAQWRSLARHAALLIALLFAGLVAATLAASPWLPFTAGEPWSRRVAISLVVGGVLATFSPTVVMAVLAETGARGPLSSRVLQLVVLGDLALVLLFTGSTTAARLLDGAPVHLAAALGHVSFEVVGSIAAGLLVGAAVLAYRRFVNQRSGLFVAALCVVLAEVGGRAGLSALIACLVAGLVVRNAARETAEEMGRLLAHVRMPVLVVFFAAAGASLHLEHLGRIGLVAAGVAVVRALLIFGANRLGAHAAGLEPALARHVPYGLVSQAGVTLGLAIIVGREFGDWGRELETLFVAAIALHEMVGPIAFRWALARMGEVPAAGERPELEPTPGPA